MRGVVQLPSPGRSKSVSAARLGRALTLVACVGLLASGSWAAHHWPHRQDRHLFEYIGQRIVDGGIIYRDAWDNKPPLLPWINAGVLALTNDSTVAITIAAGTAAGITLTALAIGTSSWFGWGVACLVCLLAAGVLSLRHYDGCTDGTELYAAMFDSIAAACLLLSWDRRGMRSLALSLLAGVGFAAAFATKQNAIAGPIVAAATMLAVALTTERRAMLGRVAGLATGFGAALAAVALVLHWQRALDDAIYAVFTANKVFISTGLSWWRLDKSVYELMVEQLSPLVLLIWLALLGLAGTFWPLLTRDSRLRQPEHRFLRHRRMAAMMGLWLLLSAYTALWGGCHLTRYWHVCFVPLFWLSAQALHLTRRALTGATPSGRAVLGVALLTCAFLLARPTVKRQWADLQAAYYYATVDSERARIQQVARVVQGRTNSKDHIYVWGYEPGIYRFSNRAASCRFSELCKVEMIGAPAQFMVDEVVSCLTRQPPRLLVIHRHHLKDILQNRWAGTDATGFRKLLNSSFRPVGEVCEYWLYEQTSPATRPAAILPSSDLRGDLPCCRSSDMGAGRN